MTKRQTDKVHYDFATALQLVVDGIDDVLLKSPLTIRRFIAYLSRSKGKLLRSQLLLCCAQNENNLIDGDAVPAAIGIELLHLATLIHDDIIDDGDTRRSLPTLNRKFGRKIAVIAGDYLLAKQRYLKRPVLSVVLWFVMIRHNMKPIKNLDATWVWFFKSATILSTMIPKNKKLVKMYKLILNKASLRYP